MAWSLTFYFILFLTEKIKRMWKRSLAREIGRWDAYISQVSLELINEPNRKAFGVSLC